MWHLRASFPLALAFALLLASAATSRAAECGPVVGDLNGDHATDILDAQCSMLSLFWETNQQLFDAPECLGGQLWLADINCDGWTTVVDVVVVIHLAIGKPLHAQMDQNGDQCPDACQLDDCGDGWCDPGESCGSCAADCGSCDGLGDCCEAHDTASCAQLSCSSCVCGDDSFCCNALWDDACSLAASAECTDACTCN